MQEERKYYSHWYNNTLQWNSATVNLPHSTEECSFGFLSHCHMEPVHKKSAIFQLLVNKNVIWQTRAVEIIRQIVLINMWKVSTHLNAWASENWSELKWRGVEPGIFTESNIWCKMVPLTATHYQEAIYSSIKKGFITPVFTEQTCCFQNGCYKVSHTLTNTWEMIHAVAIFYCSQFGNFNEARED